MIRTGLIWSAGAIALMLGTLWWAWGALPDGSIPVHWNSAGVADDFAPRREAFLSLLIVPGTALFTAALMSLAPMIDPFRGNLRHSRKAYVATWAGVMVLLAAVHGGIALMMVRGANADPSNEFVRFIMAGCGLLFIVIGNYLPKTRKSFFLGIRTPWTLTSDYAWEKTHRLAGPLYILAGLIGIVTAFTLDGIWMVFAFVGVVMSVTLFSAAYSWFAWRKASDRNEGADYLV
ncbi:SdpI family protein [Henriciella aquimarina]|uniref:SdpI family protein n=1 Tax=Henriciella aquimarina TaxID=545261 RepID=UPI000A071DE1|nr:SdpI family protein [Henriciella aquimarina]